MKIPRARRPGSPGRSACCWPGRPAGRHLVAPGRPPSPVPWRLARDLANTPSMIKSPEWLADRGGPRSRGARPALAGLAGSRTRRGRFRRDPGRGVGFRPPAPADRAQLRAAVGQRHVVLVGKGITFDSGGLSLKPTDGMKPMKTDMAGGAAVIARHVRAGPARRPGQVTGLVAAAENMPSGTAYRLGDVITQLRRPDRRGAQHRRGGPAGPRRRASPTRTTTLAPDVLVDIATLTGAARVALGTGMRPCTPPTTTWPRPCSRPGRRAGTGCGGCRSPTDYRDALDSPVADLANVARTGSAGRLHRRRPCSCGSSPAAGPGPTWTSPARPGPPPTTGRTPRAPPASAPGCCCGGWRIRRSDRNRGRMRSAGGTRLAGYPRLTAVSSPSPTGSSTGTSRSSCRTCSLRSRMASGARVVPAGIGDPAAGQRVVERHHPARTQQPQRRDQVVRVLLLIGVAEHQVVRAVGETGQHVQGFPADQPVAVRRRIPLR